VSAHHWEVIRKQIVTTMAKSVKETQLLTENPNHLNSICDGTPPLGCLAPEPPYGSFSFPPNRPCNPTRSLPLESLVASPPGFFLPTVEFLPVPSGNGSYRGIPRYTAKYRSNSNFKPKPILTASSNGFERYTAV
jgi:hypothetical protein